MVNPAVLMAFPKNGLYLLMVAFMFYYLCYFLHLLHVYLPSMFMKTAIVQIVKNKTGDTIDENNYRPMRWLHSVQKTNLCRSIILDD